MPKGEKHPQVQTPQSVRSKTKQTRQRLAENPPYVEIETVRKHLLASPWSYISRELCICYVCYYLCFRGDAYPIQLIQALHKDYPMYRVSDSTLYAVCDSLHASGIVAQYEGPNPNGGPGRGCHFYTVDGVADKVQAQKIADMWTEYHELFSKTVRDSFLNEKRLKTSRAAIEK